MYVDVLQSMLTAKKKHLPYITSSVKVNSHRILKPQCLIEMLH